MNHHFRRRLKKRYGIKISLRQFLDLCRAAKLIADGIDARDEVRRLRFAMVIYGVWVRVVYSRRTKQLVTALPSKQGMYAV